MQDNDRPFYILSCDGGGVRGLITGYFLLEFETYMHRIDPGFRIYKFFDMFAGSSAGGILTSLLLWGEMSVNDLIQLYSSDQLKSIFEKSMLDAIFGRFQTKPLYDGRTKRKFLEDVLGEKLLSEVPPGKHFVCPCYSLDRGARMFYSGLLESKTIRIVDVVDATSAAPVYFPAVDVCGDWYLDGGMVASNPAMCAISIAKNILRDRRIVVISVGTGATKSSVSSKDAANFGGVQWFDKLLSASFDESLVDQHADLILGAGDYVRVNSVLEESDIKPSIDDVADITLSKLRTLGRNWWDLHSARVLHAIRHVYPMPD